MTWQDMDALSRVTPHLTALYPNGEADVNEFNRVGDTTFCYANCSMQGSCMTMSTLHLHVDDATHLARSNAPTPAAKSGWGRELFAVFRDNVPVADCGASIFWKLSLWT